MVTAFFDKVNEFAKAAGEKTASAIETTKLRAKITTEEHNISAITAKIGAYYLSRLDAGEELDEKVMTLYRGILDSREAISAIKADLEQLNAKEPSAEPNP